MYARLLYVSLLMVEAGICSRLSITSAWKLSALSSSRTLSIRLLNWLFATDQTFSMAAQTTGTLCETEYKLIKGKV